MYMCCDTWALVFLFASLTVLPLLPRNVWVELTWLDMKHTWTSWALETMKHLCKIISWSFLNWLIDSPACFWTFCLLVSFTVFWKWGAECTLFCFRVFFALNIHAFTQTLVHSFWNCMNSACLVHITVRIIWFLGLY